MGDADPLEVTTRSRSGLDAFVTHQVKAARLCEQLSLLALFEYEHGDSAIAEQIAAYVEEFVEQSPAEAHVVSDDWAFSVLSTTTMFVRRGRNEIARRLLRANPRRSSTRRPVQRSHRGNERLTVVLAAAAGEVLLDTALLHLLWEEEIEPADAALRFPREKSALLRSIEHLSPRLGGNWHRNGRGAVASYAKDVIEMRNRVMHAGHNPSPADAASAWSSLMDLEQSLGDRLCSDRCFRSHPRTAYAWLGEDGLRRRDRWARQTDHSPARRSP